MALSKTEKKAILKRLREQESKPLLLKKTQVRKLFAFLETKLEQQPCDHTLCHMQAWLNQNIPPEKHQVILDEMEEMGGFCDCEVVLNCYEQYDFD